MSTFQIPIETELLSFLRDVLDRYEVDLLVCSERKATAILRALIEELPGDRLEWNWSRLLSTSAMARYDWDSFKGTNVLFFDELIHHGNTLQKHETALRGLIPQHVKLFTAGFAVWDRCEYRPSIAHYGAVDSVRYAEIWQAIVSMLQRHGSLLLDTEHVELTVRLQCGVRDFYGAIARGAVNGQSFSFVSGGRRSNLTLNQPDVDLDANSRSWLPPGANINNAVRKVRILERTHDEFSIVPILYPNTPSKLSVEWFKSLPAFVNKSRYDDQSLTKTEYGNEIFYLVGLLGAIELLRPLVSTLDGLLRQRKIILEVDLKRFQHLKAMYPSIEIEELWTHVSGLVADGQLSHSKYRRRAVTVGNIAEGALLEVCSRVMEDLVEFNDENEQLGIRAQGKTWPELMEVVKNANFDGILDENAIAIVPDRLIDGGLVVTKVESKCIPGGSDMIERTFLPEGEVVSSFVRQQQMVG